MAPQRGSLASTTARGTAGMRGSGGLGAVLADPTTQSSRLQSKAGLGPARGAGFPFHPTSPPPHGSDLALRPCTWAPDPGPAAHSLSKPIGFNGLSGANRGRVGRLASPGACNWQP